jgi:exosortase/archaeosortase family protein
MREKRTFAIIFALLAVFLAVLPFLVSFNEVLTHLVERLRLYMWVQERIVPLEVKMVGVLVSPLGINFLAHQNGMTVNGIYAGMTWNCIGWQSLLLLMITLVVGLRGNYTLISKMETVLIGLLGTFLVNMARLVFIVILLAYSRPLFAVVYHDYLAAIVTILWLFGFWWFSYSFVLEVRENKGLGGRMKVYKGE